MKSKRQRVLSIDWDYYTGDCQSCHMEQCFSCSWAAKCGIETSNGCGRPESDAHFVLSSIEPIVFKKIKNAKLIIAECHADIVRFIRKKAVVVNFDAHGDEEELDHGLNCGNWGTYCKKYKDIKYIRISPLSTYNYMHTSHFFDLVFMCLSKPWTPQYCDHFFYDLVFKYSNVTGSNPSFVGPARYEMSREYKKVIVV